MNRPKGIDQLECFASEEEIFFRLQAINDHLCYLKYC